MNCKGPRRFRDPVPAGRNGRRTRVHLDLGQEDRSTYLPGIDKIDLRPYTGAHGNGLTRPPRAAAVDVGGRHRLAVKRGSPRSTRDLKTGPSTRPASTRSLRSNARSSMPTGVGPPRLALSRYFRRDSDGQPIELTNDLLRLDFIHRGRLAVDCTQLWPGP